MSAHGGPDIVEDGLVLALDAANVKSFRGEPTVNLVPSPTNLSTGWTTATSNATVNQQTLSDGTGIVTYTRNSESSGFAQRNCILGVTADGVTPYTITVTYEVLAKTGNPNFQMAVRRFNTPFTRYVILSMSTELGRHTVTATAIPPDGEPLGIITNLTTANTSITVRFIEVQVEQKPYATPFVNGTRGANVATGGGWEDMTLSGNNGALTNSPTFNSDNLGSLIFDGADDYITLSNPNWSSIFNNTVGNNFSLRCIIKPTNIGTHQALISQRHGDAMSLFLLANGKVTLEMDDTNTRIGTTTTLQNNNWYDITVTFVNNTTQSRAYYYVNGQFERDELKWDGNGTEINNNLWIGWQSRDNYGINPTYFNGNISQVQIYNRALTAQEVLQNYNATKGRYGL